MARSVLWVIKGLGPGGAERLLAEAAAALVASDVTLSCAYVVPTKRHLVPVLEAAGVTCACVGHEGADFLWPLRLARFVRRGGFDVVHVHSPLPGSIARLAARSLPRSRRPVVLTTEHNAWSTYRWPTRWLNRLTSRSDRHTFAVSPEAAESLRGSAARRVSVLTHGVDVAHVQSRLGERARMRAELGVDDGTVLFGTVANYREQKDYPNLLRACAQLAERGVGVRVVCVGQGPLVGEIEALHAKLGVTAMVTLLGYRSDAVDVLAACDAFVLASSYEGLPVALMEACALGLPAVLTDVGGMRAALGDDGAVWVPAKDSTALADAMQSMTTDAGRRAVLAAAASAAAAKFDGARAVAELRRWYTAVAPAPSAVVAAMSGVAVRRATADDLPAILELCRVSLGWDAEGDWDGLYRWKHEANAFGESPAWLALADGRVVGLRVFLRWRFVRDGRQVEAVRAVDTATHPDWRGKGLFTSLTLQGVHELRDDGIEMVFNTPNDQSRPGYLKMGWQDVGRLRPVLRPMGLRAAVRVARSRVPAELWPSSMQVGRSVDEWLATDAADVLGRGSAEVAGIRTDVDEAFVRWRFGSSLQPCRVLGGGDTVAIVQARRRGRITEFVCLASWGPSRAVDRLLVAGARVAGADVVLRLGRPAPSRGFVGARRLGPRFTCLMLADRPAPVLDEWHLTMGDVGLF